MWLQELAPALYNPRENFLEVGMGYSNEGVRVSSGSWDVPLEPTGWNEGGLRLTPQHCSGLSWETSLPASAEINFERKSDCGSVQTAHSSASRFCLLTQSPTLISSDIKYFELNDSFT